MGNSQDEYDPEELFDTLHHLPEHGNHVLFSLLYIFLLPIKERFNINQHQTKNDET